MLNRDNPRSLGWVAQTLRGRLPKLAGCAPQELSDLSHQIPNPALWDLTLLSQAATPDSPQGSEPPSLRASGSPPPNYPALTALLNECVLSAMHLSEQISLRYFTHTSTTGHTLGA